MSAQELRPGERIGDFEIVRQVGRGAMGVVYEAVQLSLGRRAALKVVSPALHGDPGFRVRFKREAEAMARLDSRHVVTVYLVDEVDGRLFIASQFVPDGDLGALVARTGYLPVEDALTIGEQVAAALDDVHRAGLVHRDVKPTNVMVRREGDSWQAYLGDFGVVGLEGSDLTVTGMSVGTPSYMSPEVHRGQVATPASDVYGLGCLMHALLTGRPPFTASTPAELFDAHLHQAPPALRIGPGDLELLLHRTLAKQPSSRPSAREVRHELARMRGTWPSRSTPATTAPGRPPAPPPPIWVPVHEQRSVAAGGRTIDTPTRVAAPGPTSPRSRRTGAVVGAALLVAAVMAASAVVLGAGSGDDADGRSDQVPDTNGAVEAPSPADQAPSPVEEPARTATAAADGPCRATIGFIGDFRGPDGFHARPSLNGATLALEQLQEARPDCEIRFDRVHTRGEADRAARAATRLAADPEVLAVIGGSVFDETRAAESVLGPEGIAMVSPSVTSVALSVDSADRVLHRVVSTDDRQAVGAAAYFSNVLDSRRVLVVDSATAYGQPLASGVADALGDRVVATATYVLGQTDFSAVVDRARATGADAVYFAGFFFEATAIVQQLRGAGLTMPVVLPDATYGAGDFPKYVGAAGENTFIVCGCAPSASEGRFAASYRARFKESPGAYAAEGYDAMTVVLSAIADGASTRSAVLDAVRQYDGVGVARRIAFDDVGDLRPAAGDVWVYRASVGRLVPERSIDVP